MRAEQLRIPIVLVSAVAAVGLAGLGLVTYDRGSAPPIVIADPRPDATIVVQVDGAVAAPGVYALSGDARAQDAVAAAGGTAADADLAAINLARRLRDEDVVLVPRFVPTPSPPAAARIDTAAQPPGDRASPLPARTPAPSAAVAQSIIDLNAASAAELDALPGIGPVLAQRIVDHRAANGPFRSIDDLADVQGISPRMVDELRPLVAVGG